MSHVTVLAGGTGAAKFLTGLVNVVPEEDVHVIANVGDDYEAWGLRVSPDIDRILYALSGELDAHRSWRRPNETFNCHDTIRKLGMGIGPRIGDLDLATHLVRSNLLRGGANLDAVTADLVDRFGIGARVTPATNEPCPTLLEDSGGTWTVSEYLARADDFDRVTSVRYDVGPTVTAPERVVASILEASRVIVAPSDPVLSVGPILAIPGIREALVRTEASVIAISPVIASHAVKGNAGRLMCVTGSSEVSVRAVAQRYAEFLNQLVIHTSDVALADDVRTVGVGVWVENILMNSQEETIRLAGRLTNPARTVKK